MYKFKEVKINHYVVIFSLFHLDLSDCIHCFYISRRFIGLKGLLSTRFCLNDCFFCFYFILIDFSS